MRKAANQAAAATVPPGPRGNNLLFGTVAAKFGDALDFSALPPFDRVKKYFGPAVGYVKSTDRGLLMEFISIKAPKEQRPPTQ